MVSENVLFFFFFTPKQIFAFDFFSLCRQRLKIWVHFLWLTTSTTTASSVFLGCELLSVFLGMNDKLWRKNESAASSSSWMWSAIKAQSWGRERCSVGACLFCAKAGMADSHQASRVWRNPGRFLIESSCCLVEDLDESPDVTAHLHSEKCSEVLCHLWNVQFVCYPLRHLWP